MMQISLTPARAREIWQSRNAAGEVSCSAQEDAQVRAVWKTLPGHTCWMDALARIARGDYLTAELEVLALKAFHGLLPKLWDALKDKGCQRPFRLSAKPGAANDLRC